MHAIAAIHDRFRQANAELERRYRDLRVDGTVPFICECGDRRCTRVVALTLEEYEDVVGRPAAYVVLPGHEAPGERVLRANDRYAVARVDVRPGSRP